MILGFFDYAAFEEEMDVTPGDILVTFSDGVTEALSLAGEEYGEERLLECATGSAKRACPTCSTGSLPAFASSPPVAVQSDDVTALSAAVCRLTDVARGWRPLSGSCWHFSSGTIASIHHIRIRRPPLPGRPSTSTYSGVRRFLQRATPLMRRAASAAAIDATPLERARRGDRAVGGCVGRAPEGVTVSSWLQAQATGLILQGPG